MSRLAILGGKPARTTPFPTWPRHTERDKKRLLEVLESGNWGGFPFPNQLAREFAERFADAHGARYGCTVVNGTVAIQVALQAAGIKFGDEVIVPAFTWDGTAVAVLHAGGVPVFADVDPDTYCLDVDAARRAITPRTKAILPVHLAMRFAAMDCMKELAKQHGLAVVEDCAHAHGGRFLGRGAGSYGDLGAFSFQTSKLMTAGEGGIVITSRLDCHEMTQSLVNCGRASESDEFGKRPVGGNYRITEFQAAVLLGQLEQLEELTERRQRGAALMTSLLSGIGGVRALPAQAGLTREAIYHYVFQYRPPDRGVSRDLFAAALEAEGIPCDGRFYEPVYRSDLFQANAADFPQLRYLREEEIDYRRVSCTVSERAAYEESVWLPHFLLLGDEEDVRQVAEAVEKVMKHRHELAASDEELAGVKSMSRSERPRLEKKNY
ncbi:MAG: DegT/DnrJ/EryC1/StrS family aminotransferase [Acidimicrobiia bacterium]|nr:DegT/DnrJ/EryC1/StrS family aminotransferase [Acidimicrobiia bacterium]